MANPASERRVSGGRVPSQTITALYFFGPFLVEELERYRYQIARSAADEGIGEGKIEPARISYNAMSGFCSITLPRQFTVPFPRSRRKGEGFQFVFERKLFSRLAHSVAGVEEETLKLRRALSDEDYSAVWQLLFAKHLGVNFRMLPSYTALMADMATIAAGIELLLYHHWGTEGALLVREAPRILRDLDDATLERVAVRTGVSIGVVMAAVVQLAGRKKSPLIRSSLEKSDWEPLHEALWSALLPDYRTHPYFKLFLEKLQNPDLKAPPGRPAPVKVGPQEPIPAPQKPADVTPLESTTNSSPPNPVTPRPAVPTRTSEPQTKSDYRKEQRL